MKRLVGCTLLLSLVGVIPSCRGKTDRDQIEDLIRAIGKRMEMRDTDGLMAYLTTDYSDFEGRDRAATREMVSDYFRLYRGIVIHLLSTKMGEIRGIQAFARTEVSVSSGAAQVLRQIFSRWGECYRFSFELQKESGKWRIRRAEWEWVPRESLFPESIAILHRLFPD